MIQRTGILLISIIVMALTVGAYQSATRMLTCQPRTLTSRDTLTLRFGFPHPLELAIRAPNGIWFFLVYDRDRALSSGSRPVMDKEAFDKVRGLVVPVAMATGSPWVVGRDKNEPIFSRGGEYEVVLTDALESDSGSPRYQCVGHYRR
jgi:hypothetical protein